MIKVEFEKQAREISGLKVFKEIALSHLQTIANLVKRPAETRSSEVYNLIKVLLQLLISGGPVYRFARKQVLGLLWKSMRRRVKL